MKIRSHSFIYLLLLTVFIACSDDDSADTEESTEETVEETVEEIVETFNVQLNPTGFAPLSAVLNLETTEEVSVEITVLGKNGVASNVTKRFEERNTSFELMILGLYADFDNEVEVKLFNNEGSAIETITTQILTLPLIADMPSITIDVPANEESPEFNFVNYFGFSENPTPQRPLMFDQFGDIRWYLDFSNHPVLSALFFDNGMTRLANGNLLSGDIPTGAIYEIDLLGNIINTWSLQGNGFHHHVIEKPNGNFLVTINDPNKSTIEDVVVELDRNSGDIITQWDLNLSLDNTRRAWPTNTANLDIDWFHGNGLEYSIPDDQIIVSGRTQAVVKLNSQNQVNYILAPHREWNLSGNGTELSQFLLTPLDANNEEITDAQVLDGTINHSDFEWAWYQHSPTVMPNGNIMVFDNGDNRNYTGTGAESYSRAVEYQIDEGNKTIKQVWTYGKERGSELFSRFVSRVTFLEEDNTVLMTPGASMDAEGIPQGKVVEVDYNTKAVIFEATIKSPNELSRIIFHNVLRMSLYN